VVGETTEIGFILAQFLGTIYSYLAAKVLKTTIAQDKRQVYVNDYDICVKKSIPSIHTARKSASFLKFSLKVQIRYEEMINILVMCITLVQHLKCFLAQRFKLSLFAKYNTKNC